MSVTAFLPAQDLAKDATKLEEQWIDLAIKRDGATLGKFIADSYRGMTAEGKFQNKAQLIKDVNTDTTHYVSITYSDLKAHAYGNTAIVTAISNITAKGAKGNTVLRIAWTDTWIKQADGRLLLVAAHSSFVK